MSPRSTLCCSPAAGKHTRSQLLSHMLGRDQGTHHHHHAPGHTEPSPGSQRPVLMASTSSHRRAEGLHHIRQHLHPRNAGGKPWVAPRGSGHSAARSLSCPESKPSSEGCSPLSGSSQPWGCCSGKVSFSPGTPPRMHLGFVYFPSLSPF